MHGEMTVTVRRSREHYPSHGKTDTVMQSSMVLWKSKPVTPTISQGSTLILTSQCHKRISFSHANIGRVRSHESLWQRPRSKRVIAGV